MKRLLYILFILLLVSVLESNVISLRLTPKFTKHIKNFDEHDPPDDIPVPSLGFFYDASYNIGTELRYFFENENNSGYSPLFLDLTYDYYIMNPDKDDYYIFFGEKTHVHQIGATIGHNLFIDFLSSENMQPYLLVGYIYKHFHGSLDDYIAYDNDIELDYRQFFKEGHNVRFGVGFHILKEKSIFKSIQLNLDSGNITRDKVEVYNNGEYIGKYESEGDKIIPDINLSLYFTIGYDFKWRVKK